MKIRVSAALTFREYPCHNRIAAALSKSETNFIHPQKASSVRRLLILLAVSMCGLQLTSNPANATSSDFQCTIKVQVETWFWDSDYSDCSMVLETTHKDEAQLIYGLPLHAKQDGGLKSVVSNVH